MASSVANLRSQTFVPTNAVTHEGFASREMKERAIALLPAIWRVILVQSGQYM
jgi:hypothetical protein